MKLMPRHADEVLRILGNDWMSGRDLRASLNDKRSWLFKWSGPIFYNMMNGLVSEEIVVAEDREVEVEGRTIKQRWYRKAPG